MHPLQGWGTFRHHLQEKFYTSLRAQCHFLDSSVEVIVANTDSYDTEDDDAVIGDSDEHRISGAPMASMMCVENPENQLKL